MKMFSDKKVVSVVDERFYSFYTFLHMIDDSLFIYYRSEMGIEDVIPGHICDLFCKLLFEVDEAIESCKVISDDCDMGDSLVVTFGK